MDQIGRRRSRWLLGACLLCRCYGAVDTELWQMGERARDKKDSSYEGRAFDCPQGVRLPEPMTNDFNYFRCKDLRCIDLRGMCNGVRNCDQGEDEDPEFCKETDVADPTRGIAVHTCKEWNDFNNTKLFQPIAGAFWEFTGEYDCYGEDVGRVPVPPWGTANSMDMRRLCARHCIAAPRCTSFNYPNPGDEWPACYLKHTFKSSIASQVCKGGNEAPKWDFYTLIYRNCSKALDATHQITRNRGHIDLGQIDGNWTDQGRPGEHNYEICNGILVVDGNKLAPEIVRPRSWHSFDTTLHGTATIGRLVGNGSQIIYDIKETWVRYGEQDAGACIASPFDGVWTEEDHPLRTIFDIHGAVMTEDGGPRVVEAITNSEITADPYGSHHAKGHITDADGNVGQGSGQQPGSKIAWDAGKTWIRVADVHLYDGYWTDPDDPDGHVYHIEGTRVSIDGGEWVDLSEEFMPVARSADGDELTLRDGKILVPAKVDALDGEWTEEEAPGKHVYSIKGDTVTEGNESHKIRPVAPGTFASDARGADEHLQLEEPGHKIKWQDGHKWVRLQDLGIFDGTWTEKDHPGEHIYIINGQSLLQDGTLQRNFTIKAGPQMVVPTEGESISGTLLPELDQIAFKGPLSEFDGMWTPKKTPGVPIYTISNGVITDGATPATMTPTGKDSFATVLRGLPAQGTLNAAGDEILLNNGTTLILLNNGTTLLHSRVPESNGSAQEKTTEDDLSTFDGVWTPEQTPGVPIYTISDGVVTDGQTPATMTPAGKDSFFTVLQTLPVKGTFNAAGDKILLNNGITLVHYQKPQPDSGKDKPADDVLSMFDGVWTPEQTPGVPVYTINHGVVTDGLTRSTLTSAGEDSFFSVLQTLPVKGTLSPVGDKILLNNGITLVHYKDPAAPVVPTLRRLSAAGGLALAGGATLVRFQGTRVFDGVWTEKDDPGSHTYLVDGGSLKVGDFKEPIQILAKDRLSTKLTGKGQLLNAAGNPLDVDPQGGPIKEHGVQLLFEDGHAWTRIEDITSFNGVWTEKRRPGKNIYDIQGLNMSVNNAPPVKLTPQGKDDFETTLDGAGVHGTKSDNFGQIALSNGIILIPFQGLEEFDGLWTEEDHPGEKVYNISGDQLKVGGNTVQMKPVGEGMFSAVIDGVESQAGLIDANGQPVTTKDLGKKIALTDGKTWIRLQDIGNFDGVWTDGSHFYDVKGDSVTVDGVAKIRLVPTGKDTFDVTLDGEELTGTLSEDGSKILLSNGTVLTRATASIFDGLWTEKLHPGEKLFDIANDTMKVGTEEQPIKMLDKNTMSTSLNGQNTKAELLGKDGMPLPGGQEPGCEIVFDDGVELVRVQDMATFNGAWTDRNKPGQHIWTIQGNKIIEDGSLPPQQLTPEAADHFVAPFLGQPAHGILAADGETIALSSNVTLVRFSALGIFDGVWTEQKHPGRRIFTISGRTLTVGASNKTLAYLNAESFSAQRDNGTLAAKRVDLEPAGAVGPPESGCQLHWADGVVWILLQDIGNFDGVWTDGSHLYDINGDAMSVDGAAKIHLVPTGENTFDVMLNGEKLTGTLSEDGSKIILSNGTILTRATASVFDGLWTEKLHPGEKLFDIANDTIKVGTEMQPIRIVAKNTMSTSLNGQDTKAELLAKDGTPLPGGQEPGCEIVFDNGVRLVRVQDMTTFNGAWTDRDKPGEHIWTIQGNEIVEDGLLRPQQLTPEGADRFVAPFLGQLAHGILAADGKTIALSSNVTLVKFSASGIFDGLWTEQKHPGRHTFTISGRTLTVGASNKTLTFLSTDSFVAARDDGPLAAKRVDLEPAEALGPPESGCQLHWADGVVWMLLEDLSAFNGAWTEKDNFGEHIYDIRGTRVFLDGGSKHIQLRPLDENTFEMTMDATPLRGVLSADGGQISLGQAAASGTSGTGGVSGAGGSGSPGGGSSGSGAAGGGTATDLLGGATSAGAAAAGAGGASSPGAGAAGANAAGADAAAGGAGAAGVPRDFLRDGGIVLVPFQASPPWDGDWTDKESPGAMNYHVEGLKLTNGDSAQEMQPLGNGTLSAALELALLSGDKARGQLFAANGSFVHPGAGPEAAAQAGSHINWSNGHVWIRMQDYLSAFDGVWTPEETPGIPVYIMKRGVVTDGVTPATMTLTGKDSFFTILEGVPAQGTLNAAGDKILLDSGSTLVHYVVLELHTPLDGKWTEEDQPGVNVFTIMGNNLTSGDSSQRMQSLGNGSYLAVHEGNSSAVYPVDEAGLPLPSHAGPGTGSKLKWSNGSTWIRLEDYLKRFDGLWTPKSSPGTPVCSIDGGNVTVDDGVNVAGPTKMALVGEDKFQTTLEGLPVQGTLAPSGDEIFLSNGMTLVRLTPALAGIDGPWTEKAHPGVHIFNISGDVVTVDSSTKASLTMLGKDSLALEFNGIRHNGVVSLARDTITLGQKSIVWIRLVPGMSGAAGVGGGEWPLADGAGGNGAGGNGAGGNGAGGDGGPGGGGDGGGASGGGASGGGASGGGASGGGASGGGALNGGGGALEGVPVPTFLDGQWTKREHPGQQVFTVKDGSINWDGKATTKLEFYPNGTFYTMIHRFKLIGNLGDDDKVRWNWGDAWVPLMEGYEPRADPVVATTTPESPYCFDDHVVYMPMDMDNQSVTREQDAFACQRRCQRTHACSHFAFWNLGGHCHLQDAYAVKTENRIGFTSGPFKCWSALPNRTKWSVHGKRTYLPKYMACMIRGAEYVPVLAEYTKTFPKEDYPTAKLAIMSCQTYCRNLAPCQFFSMTFPERTCQISPPTAQIVSPILKSIGGPRQCGKKDVRKPLLPDMKIHIDKDSEEQEDYTEAKEHKGMLLVPRQFRNDPVPELLRTNFGLSITVAMALCCMALLGVGLLVRKRMLRRGHHRHQRWARDLEPMEHDGEMGAYTPVRGAHSLESLE